MNHPTVYFLFPHLSNEITFGWSLLGLIAQFVPMIRSFVASSSRTGATKIRFPATPFVPPRLQAMDESCSLLTSPGSAVVRKNAHLTQNRGISSINSRFISTSLPVNNNANNSKSILADGPDDQREFVDGIPVGPPRDLDIPETTPLENYERKRKDQRAMKEQRIEEKYVLRASHREETGPNNRTSGSKVSRRLRRQGLIPGVIYGNTPEGKGKGPNHPLNAKVEVVTEHSDLQRELRAHKRAFESRVYELRIDGSDEVHSVLPRHCQMHPIDNQVLNCNFLRYWPGRTISIPLKYSNEELSPALKRGAFVLAQNRFVDCVVEEGAEIPEYIEVDCGGLVLKMSVRLDRLILPEGVKWGKKVKPDFLVGSVFGRSQRDAE